METPTTELEGSRQPPSPGTVGPFPGEKQATIKGSGCGMVAPHPGGYGGALHKGKSLAVTERSPGAAPGVRGPGSWASGALWRMQCSPGVAPVARGTAGTPQGRASSLSSHSLSGAY